MSISVDEVLADPEEEASGADRATATQLLDPPPRRSIPRGIPEREDAAGLNLLALRPVAALLKSRLYPGILQWPATIMFVVVGWQLLLGPDSAHDNLGTALMWVLWWPLIPIFFIALGRLWCAVCPFGLINDLVQRLVGVEAPVPTFLKKYGVWIIDGMFLLITWSDLVFGIVESPWGSGMLLLLLTTAVVVSGAVLQRRAFCRYLCFLGGLSGNYARTGVLALRTTPEICAKCSSKAACFNGSERAPGCPLFQYPRKMDSNADCNLCAACIKNCPDGSITLTARPPTKELWFIRRPKLEASFLATAIMGIVLIQNATMLEVWQSVLDWVERTTGVSSYAVVFTIAFAVAVGVPAGLVALASAAASRANGDGLWKNYARFGYALIPLDMAGHIAHNLFHLLAEGKAVVFTAMPLFGKELPESSTAFVGTGTIQVLQYVLLALGLVASMYAALRIARRHAGTSGRVGATFAPFAALLLVFGAVNVVLFALPMAMRM